MQIKIQVGCINISLPTHFESPETFCRLPTIIRTVKVQLNEIGSVRNMHATK